MCKESFKGIPLLAAHETIPIQALIDIAYPLAISEFLGSKPRAFLAEVPGVVLPGELLVGSVAVATPAVVADSLLGFVLPVGHSRTPYRSATLRLPE